jgi:hypothetical protein
VLVSAVANEPGVIVVSMAEYRYDRCRPVPPTIFSTLPVAAKLRNGETQPDLDLIKQVEQVTNLVFEEAARHFARIRSIGITGR